MGKDKLAEILQFFQPLSVSNYCEAFSDPYSMGSALYIHRETAPLSSSQRFDLAIAGVVDDQGSFDSANAIRAQLYSLKLVAPHLKIADLGNLKHGQNRHEAVFALQEACAMLFEQRINVLLIGGSQLFTLGQLRSCKEFEHDINLAVIDSKIDYGSTDLGYSSTNFLKELIEQEASSIYNISVIGFQSYFVDNKQIEIFDRNHFELYRLGYVRSHFEDIEAVLRDADLVSFDLASVRLCDAPGQMNGSPNGLYAEEVCTLARYAGMSDRCRSFAVSGYNPADDQHHQSAMAIAQLIWYYIEGYHQRKNDFPVAKLEDYIKYSVFIDEIDFPIVFYKSEKSQRWWLEIDNMEKNVEKNLKIVVSCSENDYHRACRNEIPERWWINFKKLR